MKPLFPLELLIEIIICSSKSDLPVLCRTTKALGYIAEPLLYRDISISCISADTLETPNDEMFRRLLCLYGTIRNHSDKAAKVLRMEVMIGPTCVQITSRIIPIYVDCHLGETHSHSPLAQKKY